MAHKFYRLGRAAACLASLGFLISPIPAQLPSQPLAAAPAGSAAAAIRPLAATTTSAAPTSAPVAVDISLATGGALRGQVVTPNGAPVVGADVHFWFQQREVATTQTDDQGGFSIRGLRGGTYEVITPGASRLCRLWAPGTAPPGALGGVLLVSGSQIVRGDLAPLFEWWVDPCLCTGLVAAAIAVPLLILNDDDDDPPPSSP